MGEATMLSPVIRRAGEGSKRWFYGGGVWTWKLSAEDSDDLSVVEVELDGGKQTPVHTHPVAESAWILEGRLRYRIEADDFELGVGDYVMVPRGVPHAFMVVSDHARILGIQPSHVCDAFYLGASEPLEGSTRETDFRKLAESAAANGGITILGPPPF